MGGQICFTSKVDEGTSFVITLPFQISSDRESKMPESSVENVSLKGKRALLVAMSANAFQDDVERSKKAGINKHIAKPLTGESVIREIKSML